MSTRILAPPRESPSPLPILLTDDDYAKDGGMADDDRDLSLSSISRDERAKTQVRLMMRLHPRLLERIDRRAADSDRSRNWMLEHMLIFAERHMP